MTHRFGKSSTIPLTPTKRFLRAVDRAGRLMTMLIVGSFLVIASFTLGVLVGSGWK